MQGYGAHTSLRMPSAERAGRWSTLFPFEDPLTGLVNASRCINAAILVSAGRLVVVPVTMCAGVGSCDFFIMVLPPKLLQTTFAFTVVYEIILIDMLIFVSVMREAD